MLVMQYRKHTEAVLYPTSGSNTLHCRSKKLPTVLSRDEARNLLAQPNRRYPTGLRNAVMIAVMYRAGLRASEVLNLLPQHIDSRRSQIKIVGGKGDKDRTVPVEPMLIDSLKRWMETRAAIKEKAGDSWGGSRAVFTTLKGEPINDRYLRAMVKREAQAAGIEKDVHPHTLRHTFATELLEEGFTIREVQELLGHSDVSTTMLYTHVSPIHLADKMASRSA